MDTVAPILGSAFSDRHQPGPVGREEDGADPTSPPLLLFVTLEDVAVPGVEYFPTAFPCGRHPQVDMPIFVARRQVTSVRRKSESGDWMLMFAEHVQHFLRLGN